MAGSIKVPVARSPQTNVQSGSVAYQRAAQSIDYSSISRALRQASDDLTAQKKQQTAFALRGKVLEETNFMLGDFDQRTLAEPPGADNFTPRYLSEMEERHQRLIDEQYAAGVDPDDLDDFSNRLGSLRTSYAAKALDFQRGSQGLLADIEGEKITTYASQYAAANPLENYSSAVQEVTDFWDRYPGISANIREARKAQAIAAIQGGARKASALMNPEIVLEKLDPMGLTAKPTTVSGTGPIALAGNISGDRKEVADTLLSGGLPPQVVAGFLGNFDVEAGYGGALGDGGTASGIAQWRKERRDAFKIMFGKDPHQATKAEQAQFVVHEMNNPEAAGMTKEQRDKILAAPTAEAAAELIDEYYERSSGAHRGKRREAAGKYAVAGTTETTVPAERGEYDPTTIRTGIALFDDMTGEQRLQVVGWAREQLTQRDVSTKAEFDVKHNNLVAAAKAGQPTPEVLPLEDYVRTYGALDGPRKHAEATANVAASKFMDLSKTQSMATVEANLEALRPTDVGAVDYQQKLAAYTAAQQGARQLKEAREKDPAAYVLQTFPQVTQRLQTARTAEDRKAAYAGMDRAFEQLGIPMAQRKPLTEEGVASVKAQYEAAAPAQRLALLGQWSSEMGKLWQPFIGQIASTGAATTFVMHYTLRDVPGRDGLLTNIMAGQDIIRLDPARKPSQDMANAAYRAGMKQALQHFNPLFSASVNEAAAALYVKNGGQVVTGTKLDPASATLYNDALRQVLGGQAGDVNTGVVQVNGSWMVLPPGTNKQQFENWQDGLTFAQLQRANPGRAIPLNSRLQPVNVQDIVDYGQFVLAAPGQYWIKLSTDGGFVKTGNGQNYVVNLDAAAIRSR